MAGYRKLGRPTDQRRAMLRNLVTSFLKHGKIERHKATLFIASIAKIHKKEDKI